MKIYPSSGSNIPPKILMKINKATYGYDAIALVLDWCSDKLDGFDGYGDSFDVSYQGSTAQLQDEIFDILSKADLSPVKYGDSNITYTNGSYETNITISELPEDEEYTFTENSTGYGISVEEVY